MSISIPNGPGAKKTLEILPKTYFVEVDPSPQTPVVKEKSHIIGYDFMLWAYKGVPDDVVIKVVKALYEHADEVKASSADLARVESQTDSEGSWPRHGIPSGSDRLLQDDRHLEAVRGRRDSACAGCPAPAASIERGGPAGTLARRFGLRAQLFLECNFR